MTDGDRLLLRVDVVKDEETMIRAHDDSAGVSAEFNRNILHVVNHELDGDIPVEAFEHVTRFDYALALGAPPEGIGRLERYPDRWTMPYCRIATPPPSLTDDCG